MKTKSGDIIFETRDIIFENREKIGDIGNVIFDGWDIIIFEIRDVVFEIGDVGFQVFRDVIFARINRSQAWMICTERMIVGLQSRPNTVKRF